MRVAVAAFQAAAVVVLLAHAAHAIQNVSVGGRYLYTADGNRFYIKGIAYQGQGAIGNNPNAPFEEPTSFTDPLADSSGCTRDLPFLQQLTVNTIRVYSVNASLNHDSCMQAFSNAGIYTIIDLSLPVNGSLDRDSPAWTTNLQDLYIETINAFSKYDNVLAFNVGNEVVTAANETDVAPYIKAAARDIKAYLRSQGMNTLVGYASIDGDRPWLDPLANYLSCDSDALSLDIFGLNNYGVEILPSRHRIQISRINSLGTTFLRISASSDVSRHLLAFGPKSVLCFQTRCPQCGPEVSLSHTSQLSLAKANSGW